MSLKIHRAPLALASDGSIIINVHHVTGETNLAALIAQAAERGGTVFIGLLVEDKHRAIIAEAIDDAATEAASVVLAKK